MNSQRFPKGRASQANLQVQAPREQTRALDGQRAGADRFPGTSYATDQALKVRSVGPSDMLAVKGLTFVAGKRRILDSADVECGEGQILGLLGPSGSGKSTLAKIVAGLLEQSEGQIWLGVEEVRGAAAMRPVSFLQQGFPLYPHKNVHDNAAVGLRGAAGNASEVDSILNSVRISDALWQRKPANLSGGETQRVALAKALLKAAKVLILDEPFSNLHKELRVELGHLIRRRVRERGQACIYISHDEHDLLLVADRIALLEGGHITQAAPLEDLIRKPATARAASIASELGLQWLSAGEWASILLHCGCGDVRGLPRACERIAWRPDDATLTADDTPETAGGVFVVRGEVRRVMTAGKRIYCAVAPQGLDGSRELWSVFQMGCAPFLEPREGVRVRIHLPENGLVYLDHNDRVIRLLS